MNFQDSRDSGDGGSRNRLVCALNLSNVSHRDVCPLSKILLLHFKLFSQLDDLASVGLPRAKTHHFPHGSFKHAPP
jgi:hypothetical protein